jgi:hypothetical protein
MGEAAQDILEEEEGEEEPEVLVLLEVEELEGSPVAEEDLVEVMALILVSEGLEALAAVEVAAVVYLQGPEVMEALALGEAVERFLEVPFLEAVQEELVVCRDKGEEAQLLEARSLLPMERL